MKRTICILIIIALLCGASACADRHLDIAIIPAGNPDAALTFDLYEQDGAVYTLSSLFSEYVYKAALQECISVTDFTTVFSMCSELASETDKIAGARFTQWLDKRLSEPRYCTWAGELFENASSVRYAEFSLDELIDLFEAADDAQSHAVDSFVYRAISNYRDSGLTVSISSFDEGNYLSATVYRREDVIMSISADCSADGEKRVLISYREDGKYYYRDTALRYDDDSCSVSSQFYSGDNTSSLSAGSAALLFTETFTAKHEADRRSVFESTFISPALGDSFAVTGMTTAADDNCTRLEASACIGDPSNEVMRIIAFSEPMARHVSFTDKETVTADNKTGNDGIKLSATTGLLLFAAEIYSALPETYWNLLWNLPFQ